MEHTLLHKPDPSSIRQQAEDKMWLIEHVGRRIGQAHNGQRNWYVLDGKVYLHYGDTQSEFVDEFFSFCQSLREGKVTGFRRVNNFHLNNNGD